MDLDWITLYDYISIFSRSEFKSKINKFYESFYPLKLKKTGRKEIKITKIERPGFFGIVANYLQKILFTLEIYLEAEYYLNTGKTKDSLRLCKMFVEIQTHNIEKSLELQKQVYVITEAYKQYTKRAQQKTNEKGFLQIKLLCALNRAFEFFYTIYNMKNELNQTGFNMLFDNLKTFTINACEISLNHIKLFPEIGEVLRQILYFFQTSQKQLFNFHSHLMQERQSAQFKKRCFPLRVKKLFAVIPNKQKSLFVNLNGDENFAESLSKTQMNVPKQAIDNYFRCQQQINAIVAEQQNFVQSILVPQIYRGKPEWKKKVTEQLVNLSLQKNITQHSKLMENKYFRLTDDFPLNLH